AVAARRRALRASTLSTVIPDAPQARSGTCRRSRVCDVSKRRARFRCPQVPDRRCAASGTTFENAGTRKIPVSAACMPQPQGRRIVQLFVTRYARFVVRTETGMPAPAERMKTMRERRQARGLREVRLVAPDARLQSVRRRVADQVAGLS